MAIFAIIFLVFTPVVLAIISEYFEIKKINNGRIKKKVSQPKQKVREQKTRQVEKEYGPVYEDCVEALKSLGMKKMDAKIKTKMMFNSCNYNNVEQFLMDVYKNG